MPRVLMVGDVAGVSERLGRLIDDEDGWDVVLLPSPAYGARAPRVLKMFLLPIRASHLAFRTWRARRRHRPDVIHLHWARLAPFVPHGSSPLVVHAHGTDVRPGLGNPLTRRLVRRTLQRVSLRIVATPDLDGSMSDSRYLPNVVDTNRFSPEPAALDGDDLAPSGDHPPTVLIFARLSAIKGATTILDALERSERISACRVVAIESGGEFEERARASGVTLVPAVEHDDLPTLLHDASIVIGQQRLGALGLSELEAMACGRAVLAHIDDDLYHPAPPVVPTTGADQLARALDRLIEQPDERAASAAAARQWVVEHHSPDAVRDQLLELYRSVLPHSPAALP